jgi:hypothetical protein
MHDDYLGPINFSSSTDAITFSRICHITTEPIDRASVTLDSIDSMLIARGHIIICGISHNFIDFVKMV